MTEVPNDRNPPAFIRLLPGSPSGSVSHPRHGYSVSVTPEAMQQMIADREMVETTFGYLAPWVLEGDHANLGRIIGEVVDYEIREDGLYGEVKWFEHAKPLNPGTYGVAASVYTNFTYGPQHLQVPIAQLLSDVCILPLEQCCFKDWSFTIVDANTEREADESRRSQSDDRTDEEGKGRESAR